MFQSLKRLDFQSRNTHTLSLRLKDLISTVWSRLWKALRQDLLFSFMCVPTTQLVLIPLKNNGVLAKLFKAKGLFPFFDSAYQGFATGDLRRDAQSIHIFLEEGLQMVIAQSLAKNMGLYGERIGLFTLSQHLRMSLLEFSVNLTWLFVLCIQAPHSMVLESLLKS